jgi:ribose transport system substrate-binding protein
MLSTENRRRVSRGLAPVAALGAMTLLAACGSSSNNSSTASSGGSGGGKPAKLAIVVPAPSRYWNEPWAAAVKDAGKKYGFSGDFVGPPGSQVFNLTQQNSLIDSLAAKGYNGFGLFPGDAQGSNAELQKLNSRGIKSIAVNGCTNDPTPALFCVSTNVGPAAKYQAQELIKAIGGKGNIALLTSQATDTNTQLRIKAVKEAVAEAGGKVKLVQTVTDPGTPQDATNAISALLASKGGSLAGILSTSENPSVSMATLLTDNAQYRHIKFIGAENSPQVMSAIDKGYVTGTLFQNTYGMAYVASYSLYKVIQEGCTVRSDATFQSNDQTKKLLEAGVLVVDKSNYSQYAGKFESLPADTDKLMKAVDSQILSCSK